MPTLCEINRYRHFGFDDDAVLNRYADWLVTVPAGLLGTGLR
ncbi:Uncharacterised protein [Vibrio cholerae]|nr:Uncharacterised protein [Vibrio cholerae]